MTLIVLPYWCLETGLTQNYERVVVAEAPQTVLESSHCPETIRLNRVILVTNNYCFYTAPTWRFSNRG
jgi:hypothetical protein